MALYEAQMKETKYRPKACAVQCTEIMHLFYQMLSYLLYVQQKSRRASTWNDLHKIGGMAALAIIVLITIQMFVFFIWTPPTK